MRDLSELDPTATPQAGWRAIANSPRLDEDAMPKDRIALLVSPDDEGLLFVAGNAGALSWRVDWRVCREGSNPGLQRSGPRLLHVPASCVDTGGHVDEQWIQSEAKGAAGSAGEPVRVKKSAKKLNLV